MKYNCNTYNIKTSDEINELLEIIKECKKEERKNVPAVTYKQDEITRQLRKTISINQQKLVQMGISIDKILEKTECI